MYKLAAFDVDGTLLDDRHALPACNKTALFLLQNSGVHVSLATGKSYITIKKLITDIGLSSLQITNDGALVVDPCAEKTVMEYRLPSSLSVEAIKITRSMGATAVLVNETNIFAEECNPDTDYMESFGDPHPIILPKLEDALQYKPTHIMVITFGNIELYERVYNKLTQAFETQLNIIKSSPFFIEVLNPDASKGKGLSFLMDYYSIKKSEVVCFGDSLNDMSMFDIAGYSIAMGNSKGELKKAASLITDTNNNCGVAKALDHMFGINSLQMKGI